MEPFCLVANQNRSLKE
jgi:hypothetical protein